MSIDDPAPLLTRNGTLALPDERPSYVLGQNVYAIVVTGADTAGVYAILDGYFPPNGESLPHCHAHEEMFFVIDGELDVFYNEARVVLGPFAGINISSWTPHMVKNLGKAPVRVLITASPAGLENHLLEIGKQVATRTSLPPTLSEMERENLIRLMLETSRRYNNRLLPEDMFDHLMADPTS